MNAKKVLIVYDIGSQAYLKSLASEIDAQIGPVTIVLKDDLFLKETIHTYDIILVDVSDIEEAHRLIIKIHREQPEGRIIVLTSTPTWKQAREYIRVGAANLIRKSADTHEIINELQKM